MLKFSVIIPMYNSEAYIETCVRSVMSQDYENLEIILVNDGSSDQTESISLRLAAEDCRIIYLSQPNQGPAIARQTGLRSATGDYISFVDADDFLEKDLYTHMSSVCNEDIDIVEFGYCIVWDNHKVPHLMKPLCLEGIACLSHYIHQKNVTNYLCNKIFRSHLFERVDFPKLYLSEDQCILAQLYHNASKIVTVENVYYNYRTNPSSLCNSSFSARTMDTLKANDYIYNFLLRQNVDFAAVQAIMGVNAAILVHNKLTASYHGADKHIYKQEIRKQYRKWLAIAKAGGIFSALSVRQKAKWAAFYFAPSLVSLARKIHEHWKVYYGAKN